MFRQTPMILPGPEVAPDNSQTLDIMGRLSQQIGVNLKQRADTKKAQELASILVNGSPEQKQDAQIQIGAMQAQDQLNQRTQAARQQNKIQSNMQRIMSDDTTRNALIKLQQLNPQMASTLVGAMVQEDQAAQAEIAALSKKAQNFYTNAISFAVDESRGGIESAKKFVFDKRQELQRQGQPTNILDNMLSQPGDEFIASLYHAQAEAGAVNEIPSLQQAFENSIAERETSVKEQNANTSSGRLRLDQKKLSEELARQDNPPPPDFKEVQSLRKEFMSETKDFVKVNDAYTRVIESAKDPSAAGDMALIFNYMKILDPGSTVREGEFATAQNAGGINDRVSALYNSVIDGRRLTDNQRKDFLNRAKKLYSGATRNNKKRESEFVRLAKLRGINPEEVIVNRVLSETEQTEAPSADFDSMSDEDILKAL